MTRGTTMQPIDVRFPASHLRYLAGLDEFIMVVTKEDDIYHRVDLDSLVRGVAIRDDVWPDILRGEEGEIPKRMLRPLFVSFFDVRYLRDCRLRHIVAGEWRNAYGIRSAAQMLRNYEHHNLTLDSPVRVLALTTPNYDLRELREQYSGQA